MDTTQSGNHAEWAPHRVGTCRVSNTQSLDHAKWAPYRDHAELATHRVGTMRTGKHTEWGPWGVGNRQSGDHA